MFSDFDPAALVRQFITPERVSLGIRVILILAIGIPLIKLIRKLVQRLVRDKLSAQSEQLIIRTVYYVSILILTVSVLNEFGFKLSALLGAAGVFGVAIGFASQTSVSNIISGIFLISEKPFVIGDVVQVGSTIGTISSIDLLSIKINTPDNRFVRVPNETMIKTEVINITRFPVRRVNLDISVSYNDDLKQVLEILMDIAQNSQIALKDMEPLTSIQRFGASGIDILYGVWGNTSDYFALQNELIISIKERFDAAGIEIPYPHLSLYSGSHSDPIKVNTLNKEG
ncbi:MAG TPA: mechanosensitive ion channel family protein [Candidatus Cloacimonadota bacterium]|nr:mechanosensitive ion channel family protein [Candidatus Cloacimonadota bacterium]